MRPKFLHKPSSHAGKITNFYIQIKIAILRCHPIVTQCWISFSNGQHGRDSAKPNYVHQGREAATTKAYSSNKCVLPNNELILNNRKSKIGIFTSCILSYEWNMSCMKTDAHGKWRGRQECKFWKACMCAFKLLNIQPLSAKNFSSFFTFVTWRLPFETWRLPL